MVTRLILIRHGETVWNLKKRYCGFIDIGLSNKGKMQVRCLKERLKKESIHQVYSSDRRRALETARIIFQYLEVKEIPDLREIHFGCFEGLTYDEVKKSYPVLSKRWFSNPFGVTIPTGENPRDFKKRVLKAFKKIIALNPGKTVAVVSHGGPISILADNVLKIRDLWKQIPQPASISIIEFSNGKAKIRSFNDTAHLVKRQTKICGRV